LLQDAEVETHLEIYLGFYVLLIQTCTPNGHLYRVTYTRCCIDTINSPDDGHMAAQNMWRIEIKMHEKELCVKLVIYKDLFRNLKSLYFQSQ